MAVCKWCGKVRLLMEEPTGQITGRLCPRCRKRCDAGGKPPKYDAMSRRLPGSYESGKRR